MSNLLPNIDNYIITPLFLLLLIGGLIGVITFFFLFRFRKTPGVKYWLVWQVAASIWAFTYAFEFAATNIETKILWSKFSYFGIVYGPVAFLLFSLSLSSNFRFLQKKYVILIFLQIFYISIVHIPLVVNQNPPHGVRTYSVHIIGKFGDVAN